MKTLGDRIRHFRNLKGWTQEEMAAKLGLSLPSYFRIEKDVTDVSFTRLTQIAKVLGLTVVELLSVSKDGHGPHKEVEVLKRTIAERDEEINQLQKRLIQLLETKKK